MMETRKISSRCSIGRDRLSNLPDPVLHHILSFLDMRFVIPTGILSRRWRYLWRSLPFLNFHSHVYQSCLNRKPPESGKFSDFVNMVFLLRESTSVQSFNLIWDPCSKLEHIKQWICTAVLRNVKEINVEVHCDPYLELFKFPECLFKSKSLTSLSLFVNDMFDNKVEVILGDKIWLPSLKTLHLESVAFSGYDNPFDILLVGCPSLETLILTECEFPVSKVLTISSIQLKHLHIEMPCVKVFIVIHAPNLIDYSWRSFSCTAFSFEGLSCLETAKIEREDCYNQFCCKDSKDLKLLVARAVKGTMECLKGLYNVKGLTLSSDCLQLISEFPSELEKWSAPFSNLRYLNVETWLTRGCFEVTIFLLKNSPNIETLVLRLDPIESEKTVEHGVESSFNLKLHHLKVVELKKASGCKNELQHLKILLGNAEVLEKITIVQSSDQDKDAKKWKVFTAEVLTLPRVSPDVTINIRTTKKIDSYHCKNMCCCECGYIAINNSVAAQKLVP